MAQAVLRHFAFSLATTGLLMGCVEGAGSGAATDGGTPAVSAASRTGTGRDVEAPDVYQTTDTALWDGRPSLGGIWVASPDVTDPERVVMVNPANGKTVTGALFRRERDNPGPALQMSSDAAEALGMLAGQPAEIRVTALRRDEPEAPVEAEAAAAPAATPETATPETATPEAATEEPAADADAAAVATAATAALGVADSAAGVPGTEADPSATADPTAGEATTEEPPKRKTWKERRAEAKAAREAKKAAAAAAAAAVAVDDTETATATADTVAVDAIETAPLDARSAEATAPVEAAAADTAGTEPVVTEAAPSEPPKTRRQKREEAAAEAAAAEAPAPAPAAAGRPIQVASFSKEENAERAVQALSKIGITAQPQKSETNGKVVWGVVAIGDADMLKSIRSAGFADAFFLK